MMDSLRREPLSELELVEEASSHSRAKAIRLRSRRGCFICHTDNALTDWVTPLPAAPCVVSAAARVLCSASHCAIRLVGTGMLACGAWVFERAVVAI